jgi:hypothetical protein
MFSRRQTSKPITSTPTPQANVNIPPPQPRVSSPPIQRPSSPPQSNTPSQRFSTPPVNNPPPEVKQETKPPLKSDDLDNLLNNLTNQMNSIDSENPAVRGNCAKCSRPILGELIQALGRTYHPECWTCDFCRDTLGTRSFYEVNTKISCENCFRNQFSPRCAHCNKPILDKCISALGQKWCVDHFVCTHCLKPFPGGTFYERNNKPYCEADFYQLFAPKCAACSEPIRGDCINAIGSQWHPECFACTYCGKSFAGGTFFEYAGKPYCETHYHQQSGSLCAGCGKPITGRCVNALDKVFGEH